MKLISSRDNPAVRRLHGLAHSARERREHGCTVLDGAHLVGAALDAGWALQELVLSEEGATRAENRVLLERAATVPALLLRDKLFAHVSPVDTPSGILAVVAVPPAPPAGGRCSNVGVRDGVQDSGNLGTILRTAAAAGVGDVLLAAGCAQAWSPRVLRAGMGAHFALRIHERCDVAAVLADFPGPVVATALGAGSVDLYAAELGGAVAWLFGAEGRGLSPEVLALADTRVSIPMAAGVESLNVAAAAAICLFEQRRQARLRANPA